MVIKVSGHYNDKKVNLALMMEDSYSKNVGYSREENIKRNFIKMQM